MNRNSMLLFINVALGLSLGSGISAFATDNVRSDRGVQFTQWCLLFAFVLNVMRNFLGFVKFYDDETLRNEKLVGNLKSRAVYVLKGADFFLVVLNLVFLFLMGSVISRLHDFSHYFVVSSTFFLIRDLFLWGWIPNLTTNVDLMSTLLKWSGLDLLFLAMSICLLFASSPVQLKIPELVILSVVGILILTIVDLGINGGYYFE